MSAFYIAQYVVRVLTRESRRSSGSKKKGKREYAKGCLVSGNERGRCVKIMVTQRVEFESGVMMLSNCDRPAGLTRVRLLSFTGMAMNE